MKIQSTNTLLLLLERAGTLLLSIVLSLIVWLVAVTQQNPLKTDEYQYAIPVAFQGLDTDLQSVQDLGRQTTRIRLKAPTKTWEDLQPNDFTAYVQLEGYTAGQHDVKVHVSSKKPQVEVVEEPTIQIQLDEVVTRKLPIIVEMSGKTADGYAAQVPFVVPESVTITGPATLIKQVTEAKIDVPLSNAKTELRSTKKVELYNLDAQTLARINLEPSNAEVIIPVVPLPGHREVAVRVKLQGELAAGYRLSSVRSDPVTTVLWGNKDELNRVPGFVETDPLILDNATQDIEKSLELRLPEGVNALNGTLITVIANVTPIEGGRTIKSKPIFNELEAGLTAEVELETVELILSGPVSMLESLELDDVFVILDLADMIPGSHVIKPRWVVPNGIKVEGLLPETVEVLINELPTPTPRPTVFFITPVSPDDLTIEQNDENLVER